MQIAFSPAKGLIVATVASYGMAVLASLLGYPPMVNVPALHQSVGYLAIALLLSAHLRYPENDSLRLVLTIFYGVAAVASFTGIQKWRSFDGDFLLQGPVMTLWDLGLTAALHR